jgi:hypothetical protein
MSRASSDISSNSATRAAPLRGVIVAAVLSQLLPLAALLVVGAVQFFPNSRIAALFPGLDENFIPRILWIVLLYEFLPVTALSFHQFARARRRLEVERLMRKLGISANQREAYFQERSGVHFSIAVGFASTVTAAGLTMLAFGDRLPELVPQILLAEGSETGGDGGALRFPRAGSELIMSMGFLGAYVWGLLALARRYFVSDLHPGLYYGLATRMLVAAIVSLVIYNASQALTGTDTATAGGGITAMIWPALAFTIGAFPQRGVQWLTNRLLISREDAALRRAAPLGMIEGMTPYDQMRLEEEDIDSCYDLASADLVPLVLRTPYSARTIHEWILQAKLCSFFAEGVQDLRRQGIRMLTDLDGLDDGAVATLAKETSLTEGALKRARAECSKQELGLMAEVVFTLGQFVDRPDADPSAPSHLDRPT